MELDAEDMEWLNDQYPGIAVSPFLIMLVRKFREVSTVSPADLAEMGARELKRTLES